MAADEKSTLKVFFDCRFHTQRSSKQILNSRSELGLQKGYWY